ncbi:hypothetical protein OEB99_12925 [Actinotalea sp. M2MS4P-6]|uniref:hypothetical protein n=1 Tax=Actinotalea sp. M2MS4P-6 TaxID=2983762 RepID=UPI0021E4B7AB|nr:hypothetical protein [Actinotalea sp. M2MS4P-6]MCV2395214.1 hypothetical protein [Actinotalea sp. M2MS4P-6]
MAVPTSSEYEPDGDSPDLVTAVAARLVQSEELVDRIVLRVEDRLAEELERRGRTRFPGVF